MSHFLQCSSMYSMTGDNKFHRIKYKLWNCMPTCTTCFVGIPAEGKRRDSTSPSTGPFSIQGARKEAHVKPDAQLQSHSPVFPSAIPSKGPYRWSDQTAFVWA